jgi:hypothetical protein
MKTSNRKYSREIIILSGGASSSKREISLLSSKMVYQISKRIFPIIQIVLTKEDLLQEAIQKDIASSGRKVHAPARSDEDAQNFYIQKLFII